MCIRDRCHPQGHGLGRAVYAQEQDFSSAVQKCAEGCNYGCFHGVIMELFNTCLLYTSDAADERSSVDLGGRRIIKKKKEDEKKRKRKQLVRSHK